MNLYNPSNLLNKRLLLLYERLGLPQHNFYALFDAVNKRKDDLRQDEDYLILLASIWCPIEHLFGSFQKPSDKIFSSEFLPSIINEYKKFSLERYLYLRLDLELLDMFYCKTCDSALTTVMRFPVYGKMLLNQRDMLNEYNKWKVDYKAKRQHMKSDVNCFLACDTSEPIDTAILLKLLRIFEKYVKNLMADSKNRTKYAPVQARVEKYIRALERDADINKKGNVNNLNDVIGSIFERILILATQYDLLFKIGPAYVCWIFKNRIFKIGNPEDDKVNLLITNNENELFPLNTTWHSERPTVADEAQVYLFDELCCLWEDFELGDTKLSEFLFERITPYYLDFMKNDHAKGAKITHNCVSYPVSVFSSDFLQRALSDIPKTLFISLHSLPYNSKITDEEWKKYLYSSEKQGVDLSAYFAFEKDWMTCFNNSRKQIKINLGEFFEAFYKTVDQEKYMKEYERLFLLDEEGIGGISESERRERKVEEFCHTVYQDIDDSNFSWKVERKIRKTPKIPEENEEIVDAGENGEIFEEWLAEETKKYTLDAISVICLKNLRQTYLHKILVFSKKALFQEYTSEQYEKLLSLIGELRAASDTQVANFHLSSDPVEE